MEHTFWHQRWQQGRIGFHRETANPLLQNHWSTLDLTGSERVLVPLCGKSVDMCWLVEAGHRVLGVELNELACRQFVEEQSLTLQEKSSGGFLQFQDQRLCLLCGDFFALPESELAQIDAVYDRAALIALPVGMRQRYAQLLCDQLPAHVKVLLITLEFEGDNGPPFSVAQAEVEALFGQRFVIERLFEQPDDKPGVTEVVYRLLPR